MAIKIFDLGKVKGDTITYGVVNAATDGLAPKTGGVSTTKYLRADGTWQVPPDTTYAGNTLKLTGYTKGSSSAEVSTSDTLNQAVGKLENRLEENNKNRTPVILFEGRTNTSFSLPQSVTNFKKIKIYAVDSDSRYCCAEIYSNNSDNVGTTLNNYSVTEESSGNVAYHKNVSISINNTSFKLYRSFDIAIGSNYTAFHSKNIFYILRVEGYYQL